MQPLSVYIHYPFCARKCEYCSFVSCAEPDAARRGDYIRTACDEIRLMSMLPELNGRNVRTVYIGGGTPSLMNPSHVDALLRAIRERFKLDPQAEISMETNPGSMPAECCGDWFAQVRQAGVNRISVGVQSTDDALLRFLGRIHSADEAVSFFNAARSAGFRSVSLDLIYGIPGQTPADWKEQLLRVVGLAPDHVSTYCLEITPDTPLGKRLATGEFPEPDGSLQAEMYFTASDVFEGHGLSAYEISNFAREGCECAHNLVYWTGGDYLGIGPAACSLIDGSRFCNTSDMDKYTGQVAAHIPPRASGERLSSPRRLRELAVMRLRTATGYNPPEKPSRAEIELIADLELMAEQGLVEKTPKGAYTLPRALRFVSDDIFSRII